MPVAEPARRGGLALALAFGAAGCVPPAPDDSAGDDTADTADTSDTAHSGDTADTGDSGDTSDTADTGPAPVPGAMHATGHYRGEPVALDCDADSPPELFLRMYSSALGDITGVVSCASPDAPHDTVAVQFLAVQTGAWTDDASAASAQLTRDDGALAYHLADGTATTYDLRFDVFDWLDPRTLHLEGSFVGAWVDLDGAALGDLSATFVTDLPCTAGCP